MIFIVFLLSLYIVCVWAVMNLDNCHLCGAKPEGEFGCPLCKRKP